MNKTNQRKKERKLIVRRVSIAISKSFHRKSLAALDKKLDIYPLLIH